MAVRVVDGVIHSDNLIDEGGESKDKGDVVMMVSFVVQDTVAEVDYLFVLIQGCIELCWEFGGF